MKITAGADSEWNIIERNNAIAVLLAEVFDLKIHMQFDFDLNI